MAILKTKQDGSGRLARAGGPVYAVLGSGKQGTAAAYDFLKFGNAETVWMADASAEAAERAAARLRSLLPDHADRVRSACVDASDGEALRAFLAPVDVLLSAVPYFMHPAVARAAIDAGTNMCDLGGNTAVGMEVLALHAEADAAGVTLVPDTGLAPGLVNTLAVYGMEGLDHCREVQLRCGGLPQQPRPPLDYKLVFAISGLTVEYFGKAQVIRDGRVVEVDTFTELEELEFDAPVGRCEAFVTSGGAATAPYTFEGKVDRYEYKTIRYPGHHAKFRVIKDLGLLELEPVDVNGISMAPRDLFHAVAAKSLDFPNDPDLVVVRATVMGTRDGREVVHRMDILDLHDDVTGFSAMERTTGFSAAIVCEMIAQGRIPAGARPLEQVVPGGEFVTALRERGISIQESKQVSEAPAGGTKAPANKHKTRVTTGVRRTEREEVRA